MAIILPAVLTLLWGTVSVLRVLEVGWALNDAAGVGAEAWSASGNATTTLKAVRTSLRAAGINPAHVAIGLSVGSVVTTLSLEKTVTLPVVGATGVTGRASAYGPVA